MSRFERWTVALTIAGLLSGIFIALFITRCQQKEATEVAQTQVEVARTQAACDKAETDRANADRVRLAYFAVLDDRRERGAPVPEEKEQARDAIDEAYRKGHALATGGDCDRASERFEEAVTKAHEACPLSFDPECRNVSDIDVG
ncbi:MAG: hypothetical protein WD249_02170 [Gaiellaceae bacterium]